MDCLFCKIVSGEIPSYTIYEDDIVKVFLDINPDANGHALIITKKHFLNIMDIDSETLAHINIIIKKMYNLMKEKLGAEGLTINQNNDCGQEIKHFHIHLLPRYKYDGYHSVCKREEIIPVEKTYCKFKD